MYWKWVLSGWKFYIKSETSKHLIVGVKGIFDIVLLCLPHHKITNQSQKIWMRLIKLPPNWFSSTWSTPTSHQGPNYVHNMYLQTAGTHHMDRRGNIHVDPDTGPIKAQVRTNEEASTGALGVLSVLSNTITIWYILTTTYIFDKSKVECMAKQ